MDERVEAIHYPRESGIPGCERKKESAERRSNLMSAMHFHENEKEGVDG